MVSGQPRQEEPMECLLPVMPKEDLARMAAELRMHLAPGAMKGVCSMRAGFFGDSNERPTVSSWRH